MDAQVELPMTQKMKVLLVADARPNVMKIAPLFRAIRAHNKQSVGGAIIEYCLAHTGQHYDNQISDVFFT